MHRFARRLLRILWIGALASCGQSQDDPAVRAALTHELRAIVEQPQYANARFGLLVVHESDGEVWFAHDADRSFVPASNTKLVSTALALRHLGPEHRIATELHHTGSLVDGVLRGDLVLRGAGDPTFAGRLESAPGAHVDALVAAVRARGIRRVQGRIVGDDDAQPDERMGEGWQWDYQHAWYAAQFTALNARENTFRGVVEPAPTGGFRFRAEPPCSLLDLECLVVAARPGERPDVEFERVRGTNRFLARGRLGDEPWSYGLAVENPTLYAATILRDALVRAGVVVEGGAWDVDDLGPYAYVRDEATRIAVHHSPTVHEIVAVTNTVSQNLYAEQLARLAAGGGGDRVPHVREARRLWANWLAELGLDPATCSLADGSGMSRRNLVTPRALVALLRSQGAGEGADAWLATLPLAGSSGTLRRRMADLPEGTSVRAKTGTLSRVCALSGYVLRDGAVRFTFSILVNDFTISSSDEVVQDIDRVVLAMARAAS